MSGITEQGDRYDHHLIDYMANRSSAHIPLPRIRPLICSAATASAWKKIRSSIISVRFRFTTLSSPKISQTRSPQLLLAAPNFRA
ncbi:hypothetical protein NKI56_31140 [Mesorhizobium sp. M0622]|uniref:hypothetical protein n=1 Tax=Mesorhizobium sp. M0622 TaxID=2956975 RepID=UPI00333CE50A